VTTTRLGDTEVRWLDGALWLRHPTGTLLLDAPSGVDRLLPDDRVDALIVTSGRIAAIAGLLALFARLDPARRGAPLPVHAALGDERVSALAEVWSRCWPRGFPIDLDARRPGTFEVPPFRVTTVDLSAGEVSGDEVVRAAAVGVRVDTPDASIALVPACRPGTTVERLIRGTRLAVVTAGVTPMPRAPHPWRSTPEEAARLAAGAREGWVVGDDGAWLGPAAPPN
jgi:hypothetical protein